MKEMRPLVAKALPLALVSLASFGCATSMGSSSGRDRVVVAVEPQPTSTSSEVEITEPIVPPVAQAQAPGRRRLSQTVTLGQGESEPIYSTPDAQRGTSTSPNVTVNNNITVVNQTPAFYGGYGGYGGYRGYSSAARGSRGGDARGTSGTSRGPSRSAWAPTGWEGAQRTAAPGRTPGIGGNWAPAPSYGPAPMR